MKKNQILYISYDGLTDPLGQSQVLPYLIDLTKLNYGIHVLSTEKDENFLRDIGDVKFLKNKVEIYFDPRRTCMNKVIETIYKTDLKILDLSTKNVRLEEVYVNLIKDNQMK